MSDHVKRDWTVEEVAVLAHYLADNYATAQEVADAVETPWSYTTEYLRAVGMPEDAEVITLTVVEDTAHLYGDELEAIVGAFTGNPDSWDALSPEARASWLKGMDDDLDEADPNPGIDPCCLMYRESYLQDHERDCPARLRSERES